VVLNDDAFEAYGIEKTTKVTKRKMIDYNLIHGDKRSKFKSLDFNFGAKELLEIKESKKLYFKR